MNCKDSSPVIMSFHSHSFFLQADQWSTALRPAVDQLAGRTVVIDPKHDTCTKRAQLHVNLAFACSLDPAAGGGGSASRANAMCWMLATGDVDLPDRPGRQLQLSCSAAKYASQLGSVLPSDLWAEHNAGTAEIWYASPTRAGLRQSVAAFLLPLCCCPPACWHPAMR